MSIIKELSNRALDSAMTWVMAEEKNLASQPRGIFDFSPLITSIHIRKDTVIDDTLISLGFQRHATGDGLLMPSGWIYAQVVSEYMDYGDAAKEKGYYGILLHLTGSEELFIHIDFVSNTCKPVSLDEIPEDKLNEIVESLRDTALESLLNHLREHASETE